MNDGLIDWQMAGLVSVLCLNSADDAGWEGSLESAESYHRVICSSSSCSS